MDRHTRLIDAAREARENAYAPYSKFSVGAAVLTKESGEIVTGCNVENVSYGATVCAERIALFTLQATRGTVEIEALAVVTDDDPPAPPCALCLQVIQEFCAPDLEIVVANLAGSRRVYTLQELLPHPFGSFSSAQ